MHHRRGLASRVAAGHANSLQFEVFCENGGAKFDQRRPNEIQLFLNDGSGLHNGYRQVILGPSHPYIAGGLAMDAPEVGFATGVGLTLEWYVDRSASRRG